MITENNQGVLIREHSEQIKALWFTIEVDTQTQNGNESGIQH